MSSSYDKVARAEAAKSNPFDQDRAAYRAYNNYFKAAQIRHSLSHEKWTPENRPGGVAYLDLASGRGGDLAKILIKNKAQSVPVTVYAALDISKDSIAEAKRRFDTMAQNPRTAVMLGGDNGKNLTTLIDVANVFDTAGAWKQHPALLPAVTSSRPYDVVGMQFALHYGCASTEVLGAFLKCVSDCLVDGGYFIGTTPDYNMLKKKVAKQQQEEKDGKKSSSFFKVTLQNPEQDTAKLISDSSSDNNEFIGIPYRFQLDELVDDVEFSIPWSILKAEAAKVGLIAIESQCGNLYSEGFKSGYIPSPTDAKRPPLSEQDEELISFYIGFMFEKKKQ